MIGPMEPEPAWGAAGSCCESTVGGWIAAFRQLKLSRTDVEKTIGTRGP